MPPTRGTAALPATLAISGGGRDAGLTVTIRPSTVASDRAHDAARPESGPAGSFCFAAMQTRPVTHFGLSFDI